MLHLRLRIARHLPLLLELPLLNGSLLMDGGLSYSDPDLALHFRYGSASHPCQMHEVPGQLSSLSSFSVMYFFFFYLLSLLVFHLLSLPLTPT